MVDGAHAEHGSAGEPVLVTLSAPARRDIARDLVRAVGSGAPPSVPRLDATRPDAEIADFLAAVAHADTGFVVRADDGPRALAIVAATAAALCGEDIRAALTRPDIAFLRALQPQAVEALREVVRAVETDSPAAVTAAFGPLAAD